MTRTRNPRTLAVGLAAALAASALLLAPPAEAKAISRSISIAVSPNGDLAGKAVTFSGKLTKSPKGSAVKIQRKVGSVWKLAKATSTTTAAGAYAVKVTLPATAGIYKYRAFAPKKGKRKAATSKVIAVTALRKTEFFRPDGVNDFVIASSGSGLPGSALGSLKQPCTPGAVVVLQRRPSSSSPFAQLGTSTILANCSFKIDFPVSQSGEFRVVVSRKGLNSAATSLTRSFVFV